MEEYYYSQMNKQQKNVYSGMKVGLCALEAAFLVPCIDGRELTDIFMKLRLDHPEIFYAVSFRYRIYRNSDNIEMIPEYLFSAGKIREHQRALNARVDKLLRPAQAMTEWEKEVYIHDFICGQVYYDKLKKPYSHEIIGPLGHGVGVCEGIAKSVKILCDALKIWCIIAISDSNPDKKIKYRHAWNVIKLGGSHYHLDATFDNSVSRDEVIRYDYFNLGDKQFFRDHEPAMYEIPLCDDNSHFYYMEKKRSFTKLEDIGKRASQAVKKNSPFVFHWRSGYLTSGVVEEILSQLKEAAASKGMHARACLNWSQGVFYVSFTASLPAEECVVESTCV